MAHTIRTAAAQALVSKALEVGIIARFIKDGEFYELQTREEGEKRYSHVYDDTAFEDVASTLQGMINELTEKAEKQAANLHDAHCEADPLAPVANVVAKTIDLETTDYVTLVLKPMLDSLAKAEATYAAVKATGEHGGYVVRHGNVKGLYITESGLPSGINGAKVWDLISPAVTTARMIRNGNGCKGVVYSFDTALETEISDLKQHIATIKTKLNLV